MNGPSIVFVNHACFYVETDETILLVDPWVEGPAFNGMWNLLDTSTSNDQLIDILSSKEKPICIWYSHEHSDHFSVSFIREAVESGLNPVIYVRPTLDNRVLNYLRQLDLRVESKSRHRFELGNSLWLTIYEFGRYDSYSLIEIGEFKILNLNDCGISSSESVKNALRNIETSGVTEIDLLATQFGIASWVGNPSESKKIAAAAEGVLERVRRQVDVFKPTYLMPFASFSLFSHPDNFFLNAFQNDLQDVCELLENHAVQVLEPYRDCEWAIDGKDVSQGKNGDAHQHWKLVREKSLIAISNRLFDESGSSLGTDSLDVDIDEIRAAWESMDLRLSNGFWPFWSILKRILFYPKLFVMLSDYDEMVALSYRSGVRGPMRRHRASHLKMRSEILVSVLSSEYGADALTAGAAFEVSGHYTVADITRFFLPQNLVKSGYGRGNYGKTVTSVGRRLLRTVRRHLSRCR